MIRLLLLILALMLGCSQAPPTMPAPGEWERCSDLPEGVLAEADLEHQRVLYSPELLDQPPYIVAAVCLHEVCHLRGWVSEGGADCCAAVLYTQLYGDAAIPAVVEYWEQHSPDRMVPWLSCTP